VPIPVPTSIDNLTHLTCLNLGHGFNLSNLAHIQPDFPRLQKLHFYREGQQPWPPLASLSALQTLESHIYDHDQIQQVPSFDALTAVRSLELQGFAQVKQLPSFGAQTALQTLKLRLLDKTWFLPHFITLTALQTLQLWHLSWLQQLPSLSGLPDCAQDTFSTQL
jgi:hypothetical protein